MEAEEYQVLREFVHDAEKTERKKRDRAVRKAGKKKESPPTFDKFYFFQESMEIVHAEAGDATAWVLKGEKDAWLNARKTGASS